MRRRKQERTGHERFSSPRLAGFRGRSSTKHIQCTYMAGLSKECVHPASIPDARYTHTIRILYAYYTHTIRIPIRKLHICFKINDFRHVHRRNEISLLSILFLRVNCPKRFILNDLWSLRIGMRIVCVWYAYNMRIVCVYLATGMLTGCTHSLLRPAI